MPGFEGTPFAAMAGIAGMGNMMSMLAPALLGVQAGSMIGYLAQHALGRYDLPLPTERRAEPVLRRREHRHVRVGVVAAA